MVAPEPLTKWFPETAIDRLVAVRTLLLVASARLLTGRNVVLVTVVKIYLSFEAAVSFPAVIGAVRVPFSGSRIIRLGWVGMIVAKKGLKI